MGGSNQSTCPPPSTPVRAKTPPLGVGTAVRQTNPIRSHEVTARGEVDFHDDIAGFKCAVDSAEFFAAYTPWRDSKMCGELTVLGHDGAQPKPGTAAVTFVPYLDNLGEIQVSTVVKRPTVGQTVLDLDTLAHWS